MARLLFGTARSMLFGILSGFCVSGTNEDFLIVSGTNDDYLQISG